MKSVLLATVLALAPALGVATPCEPSLCDGAEEAVDHLTSWKAIYAWYAKYEPCDDGAAAEEVAYAVQRLLASSWASVPHIIAIGKKHPDFPRFVANHVGDITDLDKATAILNFANTSCPRGAETFCAMLKENLANTQQTFNR